MKDKNKYDQSNSWWEKLQPDEQQELANDYFPNNTFGALGLNKKDILCIYMLELIQRK
jgi:hypothetical protein